MMTSKRITTRWLVAFVGIVALAGMAQADLIKPAGAQASNTFHPSTAASDMIDNSGLSAESSSATHSNDWQTMWLSNGGVVANEEAIFDLEAPHTLTHAYIWNHNHAGFLGRGINAFDIYVSSDSDPLTASWTFVSSETLAQGGGTTTEPVQTKALSASNVRLVKFDFQSAHSGNPSEYIGLSEVRFEGTGPGNIAPLGTPALSTPIYNPFSVPDLPALVNNGSAVWTVDEAIHGLNNVLPSKAWITWADDYDVYFVKIYHCSAGALRSVTLNAVV